MLRPDTHFEQIPLEAVKSLVQKTLQEDVSTPQIPPIEEKDSQTSLKAEE